MHTHIIVHIVLHIVDIHEKGIITLIEVCMQKHKYSYTCMYTQKCLYE